MLKIITGQNCQEYAGLLEAVWGFRHVEFVEKLGWMELLKTDGREIDRFDTPDAIHLVLCRGPKVIGYTRLLRTSGPHLLSDVYPEIMGGKSWPRSPDIYEWTRCISADDAGKIGEVQASHLLITGVLEFCLLAGIRGLLVETHPKLVTWMLETGYEVETLNIGQTINNVTVVPVHIGITRSALKRHHQLFGITDSVLSVDRHLINPVDGLSRLWPAQSDSKENPIDFGAMTEFQGRSIN